MANAAPRITLWIWRSDCAGKLPPLPQRREQVRDVDAEALGELIAPCGVAIYRKRKKSRRIDLKTLAYAGDGPERWIGSAWVF